MSALGSGVRIAVVWALLLCAPGSAAAHCDTLDGPVVKDARAALAAGDVVPVLKWVQAGDEPAVRQAFEQALAARRDDPDAEARFFDSLVRLHRQAEGVEFTGLKPAGTIHPALVAADDALESGSADHAVEIVIDAVDAGLRERFARALAAKAHAGHSVEAGRAYVAAYVEFTHYIEALTAAAAAGGGHGP
jgi:hypothetical protein